MNPLGAAAIYTVGSQQLDNPLATPVTEAFPPDLDQPRVNQQGLLPNSVKPRHIEDGSIGPVQLAEGSVDNSILTPGAILTPNLNLSGSQTARVAVTEQLTLVGPYTALPTPGPQVTVTINPSGLALVLFGCYIVHTVAGNSAQMTLTANGTNVIASGQYNYIVGWDLSGGGAAATQTVLLTNLNPGVTTFVALYSTTSATTLFGGRALSVIPL